MDHALSLFVCRQLTRSRHGADKGRVSKRFPPHETLHSREIYAYGRDHCATLVILNAHRFMLESENGTDS